MFRVGVITVLTVSVICGNVAVAGEQSTNREAQTAGPEADAKQRARETLAEHLKITADDIVVKHIEPGTWSDSSMGCGKRGTAALTVITEGYEVLLSVEDRDHRVHVSGGNAVVCDKALSFRHDRPAAANVRGLDIMTKQARQDLAQKLGVEPSAIRTAGMQPRRWANSGMDCPQEGESLQQGPIAGYRLSFSHGARVYTYHTDLKTVRACPPIEPD